ncbi:transmembrane protein 130-like [Oncorhynchus kisutch]|uniref:Transmembrane protein 130 n=1 Tax=Oncorhynchus kisutch TaxID=8019 RepID=A0A8C7DL99_ONCKI|nr:transmembrane protein 130-like [Oncorhynchus kisutch]
MYRKIIALVVMSLPLILSPQVFGLTTDGLIHLKNITGKLSFIQREGNVTYLRDKELATEVPTETKFELFDPRNTLRTARFNYTWDFGNGEVLKGSEPSVHYNYSSPGNYTLRLRVGAQVNKTSTPLTGVYTMDVTVLDAIRNIELSPLSFQVSRNNSLVVHVDGSPPMWVCWRFLQNCDSATPTGCHLTMLYENTMTLNHTFTALGVHCLDISARNDISKLQTSYNIFVRRDPSFNLLFIMMCAWIVLAILAFIAVIACRHKKGRNSNPQMSKSSNATYSSMNMELQPQQDIPDISSDLYVSRPKNEEVQPLLQHGTRSVAKSYRN